MGGVGALVRKVQFNGFSCKLPLPPGVCVCRGTGVEIVPVLEVTVPLALTVDVAALVAALVAAAVAVSVAACACTDRNGPCAAVRADAA